MHIDAQGELLSEWTLPAAQNEPKASGYKGAVAQIACPQPKATAGWRPRRAGCFTSRPPASARSPASGDPDFQHLISFRPPDQGLPQVPPTRRLPTSRVFTNAASRKSARSPKPSPPESQVTLPLLSHVHSRLLRGAKLQLSFHLSVKARVRLVAQRSRKVVAADRVSHVRRRQPQAAAAAERAPVADEAEPQDEGARAAAAGLLHHGEGATVTTESTGCSCRRSDRRRDCPGSASVNSRGHGGPQRARRTLALALAGAVALVAAPTRRSQRPHGSTSRAASASAPTVATDGRFGAGARRDADRRDARRTGGRRHRGWGIGRGTHVGSHGRRACWFAIRHSRGWTRGPALPQGFSLAPDSPLAARR